MGNVPYPWEIIIVLLLIGLLGRGYEWLSTRFQRKNSKVVVPETSFPRKTLAKNEKEALALIVRVHEAAFAALEGRESERVRQATIREWQKAYEGYPRPQGSHDPVRDLVQQISADQFFLGDGWITIIGTCAFVHVNLRTHASYYEGDSVEFPNHLEF